MASRATLRAISGCLTLHLIQLNLFNTGSQDESITRNERRSTRLYCVLLVTTLMILTLSYSMIAYTTTIVVPSPSFAQYSHLREKPASQCFCSNMAVRYERFAQIQPQYHELCQSGLIADDWINHLYLLYEQSWNKSTVSDFRRTAVFQFQTLRSLCQLAKDTINHTLQSFRYTEFVGSELVPQKVFEVQIDSFIRDFIEDIPKTFLRTLRFVQDTTAQSLFMTGASLTSVRPVRQDSGGSEQGFSPYDGVTYTFTNGSSCVCSSSTATHCMGPTVFENTTITGFLTGCYMLSALMNSTLEAFYDQTLIDELSSPLKVFRPLNSSNPTEKISTLVGHMFVDVWLNTTSFEKYFEHCASDSCSYTISQGYNFWNIMIILLSLFGGLTSALTIVSPILVIHVWPVIVKFIFRRRAPVEVEPRPSSAMCQKIRRLFQWIKNTLINLNLFGSVPPAHDETILRQQRYQTWLYLCLSFVSLIILTFTISMNSYQVHDTIDSPSLTTFDALNERYPLTINCPCNQTVSDYDQFILHLQPRYDQICLSDFVSPRWIDLQLIQSLSRPVYTNDIQYQSSIHFQLLATLCHAARQTVDDHLQSFYQSKLITDRALTSSAFQTRVDSTIDQFQKTLPESYQRTLQLITANSEMNQFIVPLNSRLEYTHPLYHLLPLTNVYDYKVQCGSPPMICKCVPLSSTECVLQTILFDDMDTEIVPGMIQTVFPLRSVLLSTLECFYNQTCLSKITGLIDSAVSSSNFSTLRLTFLSNNDSQYDPIERLADRLFIQSWSNESSHQAYFNHCHPSTCQYSYESRFSPIYIVTTIAGLSAGLNILLSLLLPLFIKISFKIWHQLIDRQEHSHEQRTPLRRDFLGLVDYMKKAIRECNLFPPIPPSQDPRILRRNRRLTRIYLILLLLFVYILAVYTVFTQEAVSTTVENPPLSTYSELFNQYHLTLKCSCKHIAVKYGQFITQLEPEYHPICSTALLKAEIYNITWPDDYHSELGFNHHAGVQFDENDFRLWIKGQLQTVSQMCVLAREILNASLFSWFQRNLLTGNVISPIEFISRTKALIDEFKRTTVNDFMQSIDMIQVTNRANQLATRQSSNWQVVIDYYDDFSLNILALPKIYEENHCSCALQANCSKLHTFSYRTSNQSLRQTLHGFRSGCFSLTALLQSNLACFYNRTCLYLMQTALYYLQSTPIQVLNLSSASSSPNRTIETILGQLFVDDWIEQVSFERYYHECAPQYCLFSYSSKFNRVYFITTVLAVFGGLTKALRVAVSLIALLVLGVVDYKKKNRVIPQSDVEDPAPELIDTNPAPDDTTPTNSCCSSRSKKRSKRAVIACVGVLAIAGLAIVSVHWLRRASIEPISTTESTTTAIHVMTNEATTIPPEKCHLTFTLQSEAYAVGRDPRSFILRHFNGDSWLDLAVTNYKNHTMHLFFGNENGTFRLSEIYSTGDDSYPWGITSGDFNNDTLVDIAVALSKEYEIAFFFGLPSDGSFDREPYIFSGPGNDLSTFNVIEAADLNDDGLTDLVIGSHSQLYSEAISLFILLNDGDGRYYLPYYIEPDVTFHVDSIVIGDFNHDGKANDISVCSSKSIVSTFPTMDYTHWPALEYRRVENRIFGQAQSMIRGRFNDDELDDLALLSSPSDTLHVLLAYGDGTFFQQIYRIRQSPVSVAAIDFNHDSIDDLAVLSCDHTITIYLGSKLGIFMESNLAFDSGGNRTGPCSSLLRSADLNQDGRDDLVFVDAGSETIRVLLGTSCEDDH